MELTAQTAAWFHGSTFRVRDCHSAAMIFVLHLYSSKASLVQYCVLESVHIINWIVLSFGEVFQLKIGFWARWL